MDTVSTYKVCITLRVGENRKGQVVSTLEGRLVLVGEAVEYNGTKAGRPDRLLPYSSYAFLATSAVSVSSGVYI